MDTLLEAVRRHAEANPGADGVVPTAIDGLLLARATAPSALLHDVQQPLVCMVVQGAKRVSAGGRSVEFAAGDSLVVTADIPTVSQIVRASAAAPYYALVVQLDLAVVADLAAQMEPPASGAHAPLGVEPTDAETADAALRLLQLLDRPQARPVLQAQRMRELHYWLLAGRHGPGIRRLGWPNAPLRRIARAVAMLRRDLARHVPVERLAAEAGMSPSAFHRHFKAVTTLSPLQFQKRLRLVEARRLMQARRFTASRAAYEVGYGSVPQFTREYRRMFGQPPATDARDAAHASA